MIEVSVGAFAVAGVGALIVWGLWLVSRQVALGYMDTVMRSVWENINDITVHDLSIGEEYELLGKESKAWQNQLKNDSAFKYTLASGEQKYYCPVPSELTKFTLRRANNADIVWYQRMKTNEFLIAQFRIDGRGDRTVALKYKDQLKEVGNEVYVHWKIMHP